jgi:hypothetical protein
MSPLPLTEERQRVILERASYLVCVCIVDGKGGGGYVGVCQYL